MSGELWIGDNRFTTFPHYYYVHIPPQFTTTYGHDAIVKTNLSPL